MKLVGSKRRDLRWLPKKRPSSPKLSFLFYLTSAPNLFLFKEIIRLVENWMEIQKEGSEAAAVVSTTLAPLQGTFHRRTLPPPAISFTSREGRDLFHSGLRDGTLECYFPLAEQFVTQGHPAFCGIGSLTMALNSLLLDPGRVWQGVWRWFDEAMLSCCKALDLVRLEGVTLAQVGCLARCNGATAEVKYASHTTLNEFRQDVLRMSKQTAEDPLREVMVVAYSRRAVGQAGEENCVWCLVIYYLTQHHFHCNSFSISLTHSHKHRKRPLQSDRRVQ